MAVLEKTAPMPFEFPTHLDDGGGKSDSQEQRKRKRKSVESWRKIGGGGGRREADGVGAARFVPLTTTGHGMDIAQEVRDFFGLLPSFPVEQLLAGSHNVSQIRFVSRDARRFMLRCAEVNIVSAAPFVVSNERHEVQLRVWLHQSEHISGGTHDRGTSPPTTTIGSK